MPVGEASRAVFFSYRKRSGTNTNEIVFPLSSVSVARTLPLCFENSRRSLRPAISSSMKPRSPEAASMSRMAYAFHLAPTLTTISGSLFRNRTGRFFSSRTRRRFLPRLAHERRFQEEDLRETLSPSNQEEESPPPTYKFRLEKLRLSKSP